MMTKKQAKQWRERVAAGEQLGIPQSMRSTWDWAKKLNDVQIIIDLHRAKVFWGGSGASMKRLIEMGLFDYKYNITELGKTVRASDKLLREG